MSCLATSSIWEPRQHKDRPTKWAQMRHCPTTLSVYLRNWYIKNWGWPRRKSSWNNSWPRGTTTALTCCSNRWMTGTTSTSIRSTLNDSWSSVELFRMIIFWSQSFEEWTWMLMPNLIWRNSSTQCALSRTLLRRKRAKHLRLQVNRGQEAQIFWLASNNHRYHNIITLRLIDLLCSSSQQWAACTRANRSFRALTSRHWVEKLRNVVYWKSLRASRLQKCSTEAMAKRPKRMEDITTRRAQMGSQVNSNNRDSKKTHSNLENVSKLRTGRGTCGAMPTQHRPTWTLMEVSETLDHHWTIHNKWFQL